MRRPIIRRCIIEILSYNDCLTFTEIKNEVERRLGRKVDNSSLSRALKALQDKGLIKKHVHSGKRRPAYSLTNAYLLRSMKDKILSFIESMGEKEVVSGIERGIMDLEMPYIVFMSPPQKDPYELDSGFLVEWYNFGEGVAYTLLNDLLHLSNEEREQLVEFILWAYWASLQKRIENYAFGMTLEGIINDLKKFIIDIIKDIKGKLDHPEFKKRLLVEESVYKILEITEKLIKKQNLCDFINYATQKLDEYWNYRKIITRITCQTHTHTGEAIFEELVEKLSRGIFILLDEVGFNLKQIPEHIISSEYIWDIFFREVIYNGISYGLYEDEICSKIKGNYKTALRKLKENGDGFNILVKLIRKRKIMGIYLWNFSAVDFEARKSFILRNFEEWVKALKEGRLDHRIWLFDDRVLNELYRTYKRIKRGTPPRDISIDYEPWTLKDIYELHPMGKDIEFWDKLIDLIKERKKKHIVYKGGPVPKEIYEEFIKAKKEEFFRTVFKEDK